MAKQVKDRAKAEVDSVSGAQTVTASKDLVDQEQNRGFIADPGQGAAQDGDELVVCAVRMDCIYGKHDDLVELTPAQARAAEAGGYVDAHPAAIAAIRGA